MKIAHLILAHKDPPQLERLIKALRHPAFDFYIHVDSKSDITPFDHLFDNEHVFKVQDRTSIYWAGYGTIQATINGFREIVPKNYDYINVISAQDFPIKSADYIFNYLLDRKGKEFITCQSIDTEWTEAAHRIRLYHFINWRIPGKYRLADLANKLLPARKYPLDHTIVGRANWFTLTNAAAAYTLDFLDSNPRIVRYYKYCWGADEFIFSTALYNSPFRPAIVDNLVYVDWSRPESKGHPKILRQEDLGALTHSDKLFARKFDANVDEQIIDRLEEWIRHH
jgi:core-2/I-Branching enzyme